MTQLKPRIVAIVADVPKGRVTTYGAIGRFLRINPRLVARALATLTADESARLPWFRVVAAKGVVSSTKARGVGRRQIQRLRHEGIAVTPANRVEDFAIIEWSPTER